MIAEVFKLSTQKTDKCHKFEKSLLYLLGKAFYFYNLSSGFSKFASKNLFTVKSPLKFVYLYNTTLFC